MSISSLGNLVGLTSNVGGPIAIKLTRDNPDTPMFTSVSVKRVGITYTSQVFRHLMDDGTSKTDGRIVLPIEIEIECLANRLDIIEKLNNALLDRSGTYTLVVRGLTCTNLMLDGEEISNTGAKIGTTPLTYKLKQLLTNAQINQPTPSQAADSDTASKGLIGNLVQSAQTTIANVVTSVETSASNIVSNLTGG